VARGDLDGGDTASATPKTVDTVVKASFGARLPVLGPLENADLVGTDLTLAIHQTVLADLETSGEPSPYLRAGRGWAGSG
jgi:3-hydroxyacyl-CoA dehydrogenase